MKVFGDRAYVIQVNGENHEVKIAAKVVNGLIALNQPGRRENIDKDNSFIKALLIAVCSLNRIKTLQANENLPKGMKNFIKGEF